MQGAQHFWNERFAGPEYHYGTEPNDTVRNWEPRLPRQSRILCVADGEGRNGVFLAEQGHDVTSVDASDRGLEKARQLADERSVPITTIHADLTDFDAGRENWDVIVSIFFHPPRPLRVRLFAHWIHALRPGGIWVMEGYSALQAGMQTGGPSDPSLLWDTGTLKQELMGLEELQISPHTRDIREGTGHQGRSHVINVWGRKPNP